MRTANRILFGLAAALAAAPIAAQEPPAPQEQPATEQAAPAAASVDDPRLIFEREVYAYPGRARRDPFMPLTGQNAGPLFSDLKLRVILYSENPRESIAAVSDAANKQYRLRRGDSVGNATVVDIGPTRVVFSVSDFGIRRQEILDLKVKREGA
jgi:hypothetical protein